MNATNHLMEKRARPTITAVRPEDVKRSAIGAPSLVLGGKYRLDRPIASGGMAAVWSATHVTLNRPVAVKFIVAAVATNDDERVARFLREAKVAASVRHKNVVDILDFGVHEQADGTPEPYMIMELLEGEALDERLARGVIDVTDAVSIMRQVLSGLDAVHAAGIVHRDLKPANVFLTDDHDGCFARVLDFGISQDAAEGDVEERTVIGTPEYMSPEQAFGDPLDHRSDLYAAGVILYEMLAGILPFEDPDPAKVVLLVADTAPMPLRELRPDLPALCMVVECAMSRNQDDRFENARAMQRALVEAWGGVDITGRHSLPRMAPVSGQYERPRVGREATTVEAAKGAVAPLPEVLPRVDREAPTLEESKALRRSGLVWISMALLTCVVALGVTAWMMTRATEPPAAASAPPSAMSSPAPAPTAIREAAPPAAPEPSIAASPPSSAAPAAPRPAARRRRAAGDGIRRELDF